MQVLLLEVHKMANACGAGAGGGEMNGIAAEVGAKDRGRQLLADLATRRVAKLRPQLNIKIHPALKPEPPPR